MNSEDLLRSAHEAVVSENDDEFDRWAEDIARDLDCMGPEARADVAKRLVMSCEEWSTPPLMASAPGLYRIAKAAQPFLAEDDPMVPRLWAVIEAAAGRLRDHEGAAAEAARGLLAWYRSRGLEPPLVDLWGAAGTLARAGQLEEAYVLAGQAMLAAEAASVSEAMEALRPIASVYARCGRWDEAARLYMLNAQWDENDPTIHPLEVLLTKVALAESLVHLGRGDEAATVLATVLHLARDAPPVLQIDYWCAVDCCMPSREATEGAQVILRMVEAEPRLADYVEGARRRFTLP